MKRRGWTIIETLVVVLSLIILLAIVNAYINPRGNRAGAPKEVAAQSQPTKK
jgi:type II secretory pathway pseudopilin PulG